MRLSDLPEGFAQYTELDSRVLAVLSRRVDGWCVYVGAVPGYDHRAEYLSVLSGGNKLRLAVAEAIVTTMFHPGYEVDLPYAC